MPVGVPWQNWRRGGGLVGTRSGSSERNTGKMEIDDDAAGCMSAVESLFSVKVRVR